MEPNGQANPSVAPVHNLSNNGQLGLEGKVAIVTGGAAGIGEAIVRLFAKHGAKVIIADVAEKAGRKLAESLSPAAATYVHCDVSKEEDVSAAMDLAVDKYGQLDIMYNNAGTNDSILVRSVAEHDMEQFDRVMNVNVKRVMHGIKHAARVMIPRKKGCIISTASVAGILGGAAPYSYTASKHAILGLTKNGAAELGKYGIRLQSSTSNKAMPHQYRKRIRLPWRASATVSPTYRDTLLKQRILQRRVSTWRAKRLNMSAGITLSSMADLQLSNIRGASTDDVE